MWHTRVTAEESQSLHARVCSCKCCTRTRISQANLAGLKGLLQGEEFQVRFGLRLGVRLIVMVRVRVRGWGIYCQCGCVFSIRQQVALGSPTTDVLATYWLF